MNGKVPSSNLREKTKSFSKIVLLVIKIFFIKVKGPYLEV